MSDQIGTNGSGEAVAGQEEGKSSSSSESTTETFGLRINNRNLFGGNTTKQSPTSSELTATSTPGLSGNSSTTGIDSQAKDGVSSGLNAGAVAGIAVGCIVAGLVLGFLAALVFFGRRKKQKLQEQQAQAAYVVAAGREPKNHSPVSETDTIPDKLQLNQFLALATPDEHLANELRSLGDLIQAHVENNYHSQPVQANPKALSQALANLGVGTTRSQALSTDQVVAFALDPRTRQVTIRHVLAHVLFTSVDFGSKSRLTMLPAPIAAFLQSMPPVEKVGGNEAAMNLASSRWRSLGAFLLNPTRSQRNTLSPSEPLISQQADGIVVALNSFLAPFVPADLRQQQATHLQAVVIECAKFGYTLLSQPSDWSLNLSSSQQGYHGAVVCAGLDKLSTNEGEPYNLPKSLAAPLVMQV